MKLTNLGILLVSLLVIPAFAQTNENWTDVNLSAVDSHVIPRYDAFAGQSSLLTDSASQFCSDPNSTSLQHFQNAFHDSMDAWEGIQHIQFGPITYFNWNFRLQYWPDDKGTGAKQLDALIASENEAALELSSFARQSVGIQGFPALEKLLFSDDSLEALQNSPFRCLVAQTIAANINEIASGVNSRWLEEFRTTIVNADNSDEFESAEDATIDLLKSLTETVMKIADQKIVAALGESFERARVRRGESWRSERSLRNIKVNLKSLTEMFNGGAGSGTPMSSVLLKDDVDLINASFVAINSSLLAMPDSLALTLQDQAGYDSLLAVKVQLEVLDEILEDSLKNTDLYLGFNSLDGD